VNHVGPECKDEPQQGGEGAEIAPQADTPAEPWYPRQWNRGVSREVLEAALVTTYFPVGQKRVETLCPEAAV
jgi:hypothetical protein